MAVMTIYEQAKRLDPDGSAAKIAEILEQKNTIFKDAPVFMANDQNSNVSTVRLAHGGANVRRINKGATLTSSATKQIRDEIMLIEDWVRIDEKIMEMQADQKRFRFGEIKGCLNGIMDGFHDNFWYGGGGDIGEVTGLMNRYNLTSMENVYSAGGSGSDTSSVVAIQWGEDTVHMVYPRGGTVGIEDEDKGKMTVYDSSGNPFDAFVNKIRLQFGIVVKDPSAIQRVANIESSGTTTNLRVSTVIDTLIEAINNLPDSGDGAVLYVNRALKAQIDQMAYSKSNAAFNYMDVGGKRISMFMEVPVRLNEAMVATETAIS